ncbi:MAG: SDR family oxidoreductase [Candidatus Manganitrophus sp.]|nr:SDR family oxidoreductase [Candidatus Manganitrophus sp.]WDT70446.1 MAG: SDR family oxidoreductase [Candidatus Manganitrophus sp.]WDT77292.1 MAG: SDR family oxidoreductase [Candidatus Manganitrophus sp.]WDT82323.1 MAG: SDR family oxidoreductase [Candidatus Manganitrophus sp.]
MDLGLKGKVAVITGGSKGIGKAIALALAAEGAEIALCARGKEGLSRTAAEVAKRGVRAVAIPADLTKPDGPRQLIKKAIKQFGRVDLLVNNLGGPLHFKNFLDLTNAEWEATLQLDLMAAVRTCREAIPSMQRQGGGRIINVASMSGIEMEGKFPDYRVAKAALIALGKYLSVEFAKDKIIVNTVCPGAVWTPSWEFEASVLAERMGKPAKEVEKILKRETGGAIPLGMGTPEEVARLVVFLASPSVTWMTGSTVRIDGGAAKIP